MLGSFRPTPRPLTLARLSLAQAALLVVMLAGAPAARAAVSAQGRFTSTPGQENSPFGKYRIEYTLSAGPENRLLAEIVVTANSTETPGSWRLHAIPGSGFFISDLGRIVALESFDPPEIPATLRVYDFAGRELHSEWIPVATDPCLSPDGERLVCRSADGVVSLDLRTFEETRFPLYSLFAPGTDGRMAGMEPGGPVTVHAPGAAPMALPMTGDPVRIAWAADGGSLLVLDARRLVRMQAGSFDRKVLFIAAMGEELRDLRVLPTGAIELAMRRSTPDRSAGWIATLDPEGRTLARSPEVEMQLPRADFSASPAAPPSPGDTGRPTPSIPWPLSPNSEHPVGNTYNEYQNYGGEPYPHPGVDIFGTAGQHVFAVRSGVVKAVLSTGGDYYWRVAIADTIGNGTLPGYLYAHLVQSSIPVTVGQQVSAGQYIGDLINWPITGFTHTHFARIQDTGTQWFGAWMSIGNPHLYLQNQSDALRPAFEAAHGSELFAFCANETSSYQSPTSLHGAVDIIAHVGDRIVSTYVCTVQELRYTIYPAGHPGSPVVNDKLAVFFDMENDYYAGGSQYALLTDILYKQDSTCRTQGDYDFREFYQILTNSDGNQHWGPEDLLACWDTSALPDGQYWIRVVARDVAGNATTDSMLVQTANGNPSSVGTDAADAIRLVCRPNPAFGSASIQFTLAAPERISLAIYDLTGRRVRSLVAEALAAGPHEAEWNGRDESNLPMPGGIYFYRLTGSAGCRTGELIFAR